MSDFSSKLIHWYELNKRNLPWRNLNDPYKIWLSEIILQQTRVVQGLPYYLKFVEKYPDVQSFAAAPIQEILRLWQGLGYYRRARNMHQTAQIVVNEHGGVFPSAYKDLLKLKGIGKYTAAAIASFAANEPVAVIDGNVYRVLSRVFGIEEDISSAKSQKIFEAIAYELLPKAQAGIYNQALMEFGALHCVPQNPDCMFCIFSLECEARKQGKQKLLPIKEKKLKIKHRYIHYLVFRYKDGFLMKERGKNDIWEGLHDFAAIETSVDDSENVFQEIQKSIFPLRIHQKYSPVKHVLTHQVLHVCFVLIEIPDTTLLSVFVEKYQLRYYTNEQVHTLPKPILINNFLAQENLF
jgi:A/G-specific adenine glycosylase